MTWIVALLVLLVLVWAIARWFLAGENLSRFDAPVPEPITREPSPGYAASEARLLAMVGATSGIGGGGARARLVQGRAMLDSLGDSVDLSDVTIRPVQIGKFAAEWVLGPGSDPG